MAASPEIMPALRLWLAALRPRTLPLAVSGIFLGYGLAALYGQPSYTVLFLALLTALLLQILSNLANDYGDAVKGADAENRLGPLRMVGSGSTSRIAMVLAMVIAAGLALFSGLCLVLVALWKNWPLVGIYLGLGALCVVAAIAYTVGKKPYGYLGFGDLMVVIFFGPVTVCGSAILCGAVLQGLLWLPSLAAGLCSAAVLNINNMRDIKTDAKAGKMTLAVRLGLRGARIYHGGLVALSWLLWAVFWNEIAPCLWPVLALALPLAGSTILVLRHIKDAACLNRQLKNTVMASALLNIGMASACLWLVP